MDSKKMLEIVVKAAEDKRGEDIVALDMQKVSLITDYFMIVDAATTRQVQAIADNIEEAVEKAGIKILRTEGYNDAKWVLIDLGDIMVHVFQKEDRHYYNLEKLWVEAPMVDVSDWVEA